MHLVDVLKRFECANFQNRLMSFLFTLSQIILNVAFKIAVDNKKFAKKNCLVKTEVECTHYSIMNSTEEIDGDNRRVFRSF